MATNAQTETVTITINDIDVQVPKGELIVEAVKRIGLEIPIFCYHPRMKPVGMCRMCLVEVGTKQQDGTIRMMPKPQAGCTLPATQGLVVYTDTAKIHKDRKGVLEFLLINHPLDCPICDRGGECPLQNNTLFYGPSTTRYVLDDKRHAPKAYPLSKYVTLDLERCIHCGRCVRFTEEISGDAQLAFRYRGASMQPATFNLGDFTSKFSGNVIEICPVGALTSTQYRFRARPWDLETKPGICTICSNGCNVWVDHRKGKVVRINGRTNEGVNEEWTCDQGKFGHDYLNSPKRLTRPLARKGDSVTNSTWPEVYAQIVEAFKPGGNEVAAIAGGTASNEDLYLLQKLFRQHFKSNNLDHRFTRFLPTYEDRQKVLEGAPTVQNRIADFEHAPSALLFGTSLADEEPILYLRVRKGWFKDRTKVVVAHHAATDADDFASVVLRYKPGTASTVAACLLALANGHGAPTPEEVQGVSGVPATALREAASVLGDGTLICTTRRLLNMEKAQKIAEDLAALASVKNGGFNLYSLTANGQGAEELGILPDMLPGRKPIPAEERGLGTHGILRACAEGRIKALWLANIDPFAVFEDRALVEKALETVPFLVVQGTVENEATAYASVVLPSCAPGETEGTFTNIERRIQRFPKSLTVDGEAKPGWQICSEIMLRLKPGTPVFNAREALAELAAEVPAFAPAVDGLPGPKDDEGVFLE